MSDRSAIFKAAGVLIKQAGKRYREEGTIPKDLLLGLHGLFGDLFRSALDIIDRRGVIRIQRLGVDQGLKVYKVKGQKGASYTVKKHAHHCTCPAYQYKVLGGSALTCKHLLALALAEACNTIVDHKLQQAEMTRCLKEAY